MITASNPPRIMMKIPTSTASPKPKIGDNKISDNLAPTTPEPLTITSPTNLAFGSRWESIPNMNISNKIIENEDSAKLNFFFLFAIFSLLYLFIIVPVVPAKASLAFCNEVINA